MPPDRPVTLLAERYRIRRLLACTGAVVCYAGTDLEGRDVRITELFPVDLARRDERGHVVAHEGSEALFDRVRTAFAGAGQALRSLRHPGVIAPAVVLATNGTAYLVSTARALTPVGRLLRRRPGPSSGDMLRIAVQILHILDDVHRAGFIHGNLGPSGVLLGPRGEVVLDDFGTWRSGLGDDVRALPCVLEPGCSAIETYFPGQFETGRWTDVYGVAALLFWAATGRPPPDAVSRLRSLDVTGSDRPPRLGWPHGLPGHVAAAVERGLALLPDARPQTPAALRHALSVPPRGRGPRAATRREATAADRAPAPPAAHRTVASALGRAAAVAGVVLAAAGVTIALGSAALRGSAPDSPHPATLAEGSPPGAAAGRPSGEHGPDRARAPATYAVELVRAAHSEELEAALRVLRPMLGAQGELRIERIGSRPGPEGGAYRLLSGRFDSPENAERHAEHLRRLDLPAGYAPSAALLRRD